MSAKNMDRGFGKRSAEGLPFIKRADDMLRKQGYPLGLKGLTYYTAKLVLFLICFILGFKNYQSFIHSIFLGIFGFYITDLYILFNKRIRNSSINNDLMNAVDSLRLQISAHVSLNDALRGLHQVCDNPDLKKAFIRLSAKYELTEHNIEEAADEFKESFNILETAMFASALKQQVLMGNSIDVLDNLSEILRDSYLDRLNLKTKTKSIYVVLGAVIILFNISMLALFPVFIEITGSLDKIFR